MSQDERIKALEGQVEELRGRVKVLEGQQVEVHVHQSDEMSQKERRRAALKWFKAMKAEAAKSISLPRRIFCP